MRKCLLFFMLLTSSLLFAAGRTNKSTFPRHYERAAKGRLREITPLQDDGGYDTDEGGSEDSGGAYDGGGDEYDDGDEYGSKDDDGNGADEYDDGFEYELNGPGDQYIQISLMPSFPLNFHGKMYVGGAAQLGYRRFILKWLSVGGDLMIGYHPTIGSNIFNFWPITLAVTFQPTAGKFEFPMSIGAGVAFETYRNNKYFPGFVLKPEVGAFYRINESWSAGLGCAFMWLPQRYSESKYNDDGLFLTASLSVRYHF